MSNLALQLIEKEKNEETGKLDLGNCGLVRIPEQLFVLTKLKKISFCNQIWDSNKKTWIKSENHGPPNDISIEELPIIFKKLLKLEILHFGGNSDKKWKLQKCYLNPVPIYFYFVPFYLVTQFAGKFNRKLSIFPGVAEKSH